MSINVLTPEQLQQQVANIEVAVVTGLMKELETLIALSSRNETLVTANRTYYKLFFTANQKEFCILGHSLDKPGIPVMAITLMEILYHFPKLKYIGLIGIAAGSNSTDQRFGDLLIPTNVYNYEMGKYAEDPTSGNTIFKSNYSVFNIDEDILQKISAVARDTGLLERIRQDWKNPKSYPLSAHTDNFACGSAVIASASKVKEIEDAIARKYIGLDMESYALASVNQLKFEPYPKLFIIKAISDFADVKKDDSEHEYACYTSARFFVEVCSLVLIHLPLNSQALEARFQVDDAGVRQNVARYKYAAKEFDEIDISDAGERVSKKNKIAIKLAQWILENHLPKPAVAHLYSEGCLVGLVVSMGMEPNKGDAVLIFDIYDRIKEPFTKHKILDTIEIFLHRKLFDPADYKRIRQIFELFSFNADADLIQKLRKVEKLLNKAEFLRIYSIPEDTLGLNKTLRVDAGNPRFSYLNDLIFENVLVVDGDFYKDSTDILTDSYGKVVAEVEYTYSEFKQFVVYVQVRCRQEGKKDNIEKWIAFRNEVFDISKEPNQFEKALPVEAKDVFGDWKKVSVDLHAAVKLLFGNEKIEYVNLIKMRARGAGKLAYIFLREA